MARFLGPGEVEIFEIRVEHVSKYLQARPYGTACRAHAFCNNTIPRKTGSKRALSRWDLKGRG